MRRIVIDRGFMGRLARDVRGNTIAIMAAAMVPLAGLIGGGVDMSRLYLVKTRLQHACDAGALAGRKAMGAGAWSTGVDNGSTNDKAEKMFTANFVNGGYGSGTLAMAYSESDGVVNGTASVPVPMTVMKVFGMESRSVAVSCTAKMELPNTDVMFVLDVTYSMGCLPSATSDTCSQATAGSQRIDGLKRAVKCFYEALYKVDTPEVCGNDPSATMATTTAQVRIGFVPYGVNVNVGKVLPHDVMADSWEYQTRVANTVTKYSWTLGSESSISGWGNWSSTPSSLNDQSTYSGWSDISTSGGANTSVASTTPGSGSGSYAKRRDVGETSCNNLNTIGPSGNKMLAYSDGGANLQNPALQSTTNNPPTYVGPNNPSQQVLSYNQSENHTATGYKYRYYSGSSGAERCRLQRATRDYARTRSGGQSTKPITWTQHDNVFNNWTYKKAALTVSGLKGAGAAWNGTVSLPLGLSNGSSVRLSGSGSSSTLQHPANVSVTWDGCIEEAGTYQNTNGTPENDWGSYRNDALDMNVNLVPSASTADSYWGPMLAREGSDGAVWARYSGSTTSNWTTSNVVTSTSLVQSNFNYICTTSAARKLTAYPTSADFVSYVNSLSATDLGTYHDIGMLWGGRFISPTGIFASSNAYAAAGGAIQRHLIFMTDGNTRTVHNNYNAYGLSYYNRKQTSYDPTEAQTDNLTNARLLNICNQIRNMNVTLWVVSYGSAVNVTTQDRLKQCVTPPSDVHYVLATDTATLVSKFQGIAAKISELRLIS